MAEEEEARVTALLACKLVRQFSACKADRTRVMLQELQSEAEAARAEFCTLSANQCKSSNQERRLFPCWRIYDSSFLRSAAKSSPPPAFTWIISRSTASACFTLPAERIWRFGGHDLEDTIWRASIWRTRFGTIWRASLRKGSTGDTMPNARLDQA